MYRRLSHYGRVASVCAALSITAPGISQPNEPDAVLADISRIEVASGNAHHGPWRMNQSDYDFVDDPTVAITGDGHIGVAWADQKRQNIFLQMYTPDGQARLGEPVNVSSNPGIFSWLPRMVIASQDPQRVYVLWQEIVFRGGGHGGEILFARSSDGGATFGEALNLSDSEAGAGKGRLTPDRWDNGSLDLVEGPDGHLYAAWSEYEGRLWVSRSTDGGGTFAEPLHVTGGEDRPARAPALAVDGDGNVHLAWTPGDDPAGDIHVATSTDGGRSFGDPQVVSPGEGHADAPKLAVDSQGRLHLVYGESPDGAFQRYRIRHAYRDAASGHFSDPATIAAPEASLDSVKFPGLAVDEANRLYVVWERFPDYRRRPRGLGFAMSHDGGRTFTQPEIVPGSDDPDLGSTGNRQGFLTRKLDVSPQGALAVVNSTFAAERSSRIWLWHMQDDGMIRPAAQERQGSAGSQDLISP
jgi:hypothetical protein